MAQGWEGNESKFSLTTDSTINIGDTNLNKESEKDISHRGVELIFKRLIWKIWMIFKFT